MGENCYLLIAFVLFGRKVFPDEVLALENKQIYLQYNRKDYLPGVSLLSLYFQAPTSFSVRSTSKVTTRAHTARTAFENFQETICRFFSILHTPGIQLAAMHHN